MLSCCVRAATNSHRYRRYRRYRRMCQRRDMSRKGLSVTAASELNEKTDPVADTADKVTSVSGKHARMRSHRLAVRAVT